MLAMVQCASEKFKEDRHVTFDKLQRETGLCHATIHAIIHEDLKMKKCVHTACHGTRQPEKKADAGAKMS
jgi:hypothetical protein